MCRDALLSQLCDGKVVIPAGTTTIAPSAFYKCNDIVEVVIPASVVEIGMMSFSQAGNLRTVTFDGESQLEQIGMTAFFSTALTGIELPASMKLIGDAAFAYVEELTELSIHDDATVDIDINAFIDTGLTSVTGGKSVKSIGEYAFKDTRNLKSVGNIGQELTSLAKEAFRNSGIMSFDLSQTRLSVLPSAAFRGCSSLKNFTFPAFNGLVTIEGMALAETGLEEVTIPDSVTTIGINVFYGCMSLTTAHVGSGITELNGQVFNLCEKLDTVTFGGALTDIGQKAFLGCIKLTTIILPSSLKSIGAWVFKGCSSLKHLELPTGLTTIAYEAFRESGLEVLSLPATMTSVESNLCYGCLSLGEFHIGEGVTTIGDSAFEGAVSLHTVAFSGQSQLSYVGKRAFRACSALTSFPFTEALTSTGYSAFDGSGLSGELLLPKNFLDIGSSTFAYTSITSVVLPARLKTLPYRGFIGCSELTEVNFGDNTGIAEISDYAFQYASSLVNIVVPEGVTKVGDSSFRGCSALTEVTLPSTLTYVHNRAFWDTPSLRKMYINSTGDVDFMPTNFDMDSIDTTLTVYAKKSVTSITGVPFFVTTEQGNVMCNEGFGNKDQSLDYFGCALCPIDTFADTPSLLECRACEGDTGTCTPGADVCLSAEDTAACKPSPSPTVPPTPAPTEFRALPTPIPTNIPTRSPKTWKPTPAADRPSDRPTVRPTTENGLGNDDGSGSSDGSGTSKSRGSTSSETGLAVGLTFGILTVIVAISAIFYFFQDDKMTPEKTHQNEQITSSGDVTNIGNPMHNGAPTAGVSVTHTGTLPPPPPRPISMGVKSLDKILPNSALDADLGGDL